MTNLPLSFLPGVCKVNSAYADSIQSAQIKGRNAIGRFTDMDKARFIAGFPEKLGGWEKAIDTALTGVPRGMKDWRDNNQVIYVGAGTNKKLYYYSQNDVVDITPYRAINTGLLTDPVATTSGSSIVTITHNSHGQLANDYVMLTATSAVGGVTLAGVYFIISALTNSYTIDTGITANANASGGGSTAYSYFRITLTNPFDTVSGSATVTVTHAGHGAAVGDYVTFASASAVGGVTIDGEYQIQSVDTNTYTITASSNASSTATGGGTPTAQYDLSIGTVDSALAFGYGTGGYGSNGYGTIGDAGVLLTARVWSLWNYGQQLIANPSGGTIYVWDPVIQGRAYPMYGAPAQVLSVLVTPEGFIVALGVNGLAMQIAWPDQDDYTDWVSTATNTANSGRTLREGSFLVGGITVRDGSSMIFSNTAAYNFDYYGDNEIYHSTIAGRNCGLVGPLAVTLIAGIPYWMSQSEFWNWNGSVSALPSDDIRDFVFRDINLVQAIKFVAGANTAKKEVWWFYCSAASDENDRYVIYHIDENCWSCGSMERTSWIDKNLLSYPLAANASGYLFNHEFGNDDDGSAMDSYVEFNPMAILSGDRLMDVLAFTPDFKRQTGNVTISPMAQDYPKSAAEVYGPYTIADDASTPIIDLRIGTRLIGYKLRQNVIGGDWRLGLPTAEVQPAGARR